MIALILLVLGAVVGCGTPGRAISEEERCARFGGTWLAGSCHPLDDGK